jgi:hypothetical protein
MCVAASMKTACLRSNKESDRFSILGTAANRVVNKVTVARTTNRLKVCEIAGMFIADPTVSRASKITNPAPVQSNQK